MAYATQTDLLNFGFPANAVGTLTVPQILAELQAASDFADGMFVARYGVGSCPLSQWDAMVTKCVAQIAAYNLLVVRGFSPNSTADQRFKMGNDEAVAWLGAVQRQQAHPAVVLANGSTPGAQVILRSSSVVNLGNGARARNRGW